MKKLFTRLSLFLLSFFVAFLLGEIILSYAGNRYITEDSKEILVADPILHHKWRPNLTYLDKARKIPYLIETNSQSFIEKKDIKIKKPGGTFRIFFIGDSNSQGVVNFGKKTADIIENELNLPLKNKNRSVEVINSSTSSYAIIQYYLLVKYILPVYFPDLVIINIDMTDIPNDYAYRKLAEFDKKGLPVAVKPSSGQALLTPRGLINPSGSNFFVRLINRSKILSMVYGLYLKTFSLDRFEDVSNIVDTSADWLSLNWTPGIQQNVNWSLNLLLESVKELRKKNIAFYVTSVPHYHQYTGLWSDKPHQVLSQLSSQNGFPFLNSYLSLKKYINTVSQDVFYWPNDPTHFNEEGNKIWAGAHLDFIRKNNIIPPGFK